jgi:hypothetical protein
MLQPDPLPAPPPGTLGLHLAFNNRRPQVNPSMEKVGPSPIKQLSLPPEQKPEALLTQEQDGPYPTQQHVPSPKTRISGCRNDIRTLLDLAYIATLEREHQALVS